MTEEATHLLSTAGKYGTIRLILPHIIPIYIEAQKHLSTSRKVHPQHGYRAALEGEMADTLQETKQMFQNYREKHR